MTNSDSNTNAINDKIIARQMKLIGNKSDNIGGFIGSLAKGIILMIVIVLINSNIIFMIKQASNINVGINKTKELLDIWFPSDCTDYPFGVKGSPHICENSKNSEATINNTEAQKCGNSDCFKGNGTFNYFYHNYLTDNKEPGWPHNNFTNNGGFSDWFLKAITSTDVGVNKWAKKVLMGAHNLPSEFLMVIGAILILVILILNSFIQTFIMYIFNLFSNIETIDGDGIMKYFFIIALCVVLIIPIIISIFYSLWNTIKTIGKLIILPILLGGHNGIIKILKENNNIIAYAFGLLIVLSSVQNLSSTTYGWIIGGYILCILVHLFYILKTMYNK